MYLDYEVGGETMRMLASIQRIIDLQPIANADEILRATVLGWNCVVKKGEFKIGDLCIFYEIDSLLPIQPEYEFLAKNGKKKSYTEGKEYEGYRLKTIRLKGQVSQGLCLPLSILKGKKYPTDKRENPEYEWTEGMDVTSLLGVVKYEPQIPANLSGVVKGPFPAFIPKTDEERIQTCPKILEKYDCQFYVTEKVDGASCTIYLKDNELNVCSRNLNLKESEGNTFWRVARELDLQAKLERLGRGIALQGELIGGHINGNKLNLATHKILFFSIYDYDKGQYLDYADFREMCRVLQLETVPVISTDFRLPKTVDEAVAVARRKSQLAGGVWAEGVVVRPLMEVHDEDLGRLSFKVINPEFLLKYGE